MSTHLGLVGHFKSLVEVVDGNVVITTSGVGSNVLQAATAAK